MNCRFCNIAQSEVVLENNLAIAFRDAYPVSEGHTLVVPRRHVASWFEATDAERAAIIALADEVKLSLDAEFAPDGYNIGVNVGEAAGQTVMHLHLHIIPRMKGDVEDPRGGVRFVIPKRGNYLAAAAPPATGTEEGGEG